MKEKDNNVLRSEADFEDNIIETDSRSKQSDFYDSKSVSELVELKYKWIGDIKGKKVLDIGCGPGWASAEAIEKGAYVYACDISPKAIEEAKRRVAQVGGSDRFEASVMDVHNMPFEDGRFDVVFGSGILHHLTDLKKAVNEINRVLKPDGHAVFLETLGMNPMINIYRVLTPNARTTDEKPLVMKDLMIIKDIFPNAEFAFAENLTLLSKIFYVIGMKKFGKKVENALYKADAKLLRPKKDKITFSQKMAWISLIKMEKKDGKTK